MKWSRFAAVRRTRGPTYTVVKWNTIIGCFKEQNVCFSFQGRFAALGYHDDDYVGYEQDRREVSDLPRFSVHN